MILDQFKYLQILPKYSQWSRSVIDLKQNSCFVFSLIHFPPKSVMSLVIYKSLTSIQVQFTTFDISLYRSYLTIYNYTLPNALAQEDRYRNQANLPAFTKIQFDIIKCIFYLSPQNYALLNLFVRFDRYRSQANLRAFREIQFDFITCRSYLGT